MPQTADIEHNCIVCEEAITNPICLLCIEKEIVQWLSTRKQSLIPALKTRTDIFYDLVDTGISCVVCGTKMNVCSHCYSMEILQWLSKEQPRLCQEFAEMFNYEITMPRPS